jgi:hypothetical protein
MNELDTLEKTKETEFEINDKEFFETENFSFHDELKIIDNDNIQENEIEISEQTIDENLAIPCDQSNDMLDENTECTSLIELKNRSMVTPQKMFKKCIRISIKSFLISLSLTFLNLFI